MADLDMGIYEMGRASMIHPAPTLDLFKLFGAPAWVSPFHIVPHHDAVIILQRWPDLDFSLAGNLPFGIWNLGAVACLPVILPAMEGTLDAFASNLQHKNDCNSALWP